MQKRKVKVRITYASRQIFRLGGQNLKAFCAACGREVEMVIEADAERILQVDGTAFDHLVGAGCVHLIQTASGSVWVCKDSLF